MDVEETQKDTVLAETLEEPVVSQPETEVVQQEETSPVKEETVAPGGEQTLRFKTLREARERAESERDELRIRLERIEASQRQPEPIKPPQQDFSVAPDDLVEGKHLAKYDREIKQLKETLENYKRQSTAMSVEASLKAQYPDFDSVVSKENIEMLRTAYPEIAATLNSSTDLYSKAVSAYTMIKKFGIVSDQTYDKQRTKAQENAAKPRPIASVNAQPGSDSPLSRANAFAEGLTKDLKAQLYREMIEAKKRR